MEKPGLDGQHHDARAAQVCLRIFEQIENAIFVFEDAHWIDSQSWVLMQMVLPKLKTKSIVLIVTRPPEMASILRGGGTEGLGKEEEELLYSGILEEDDRVKFTRILGGLKENSEVNLLKLGPITREATRDLIAASLKCTSSQITDNFMTIIEAKAGGVPMYTRTFAAWLEEMNAVERPNNETDPLKFKGNTEDMKFPKNLTDTVIGRVDALDEDTKRLIKIHTLVK